MKKLFFTFFLVILLSIISFPQSYNESWKLYNDAGVAKIDITIDPLILKWIYQNVESDSLHLAKMHFKNKYIDESIDSIGFRLRGNTSRYSQKKSFKISFNTFTPGRNFYGVDKLNLNGEHNDPSIIRSKLCWDIYQDIGMKASRASYAEVYINGKYYGLYISVEHIDDEFLKKNFADDSGNLWKCLYPADLHYLGPNPDYYKLKSGDRPVYELTTNENENDFSQLGRFINILNNTPGNSFRDSLENIFNVTGFIKSLAVDILTGSWDDYWSNMNNYYLYFEPAEKQFYFIPYDYDNTFGIDWFNIDWSSADPYNFPKLTLGTRPLAEKILAVPCYKNLYTHFIEYFKENIFKLPLWENRIDSLKSLIRPYAEKDTFRIKDYGFNINDFDDSYSASHYSNQHVKTGLKEFINTRYSSLPQQLSYLEAEPVVYKINFSPEIPGENDSVYVTVSAFGHPDINNAVIRFTPDHSSDFKDYVMQFRPIAGSKKVEDADRWIGTILPPGAGSFRILVKNNNFDSALYPLNGSIHIKDSKVTNDSLVINEFMAGNTSTIADSSGQFDDWVELYNHSSSGKDLSGMFITDKEDNLTKWKFPDGTTIKAGGYLLIWCDEDEDQQGIHTNFKLSADGEFIGITSMDGVSIIDSISFESQTDNISYGRFPDGSSSWQLFTMPTPGTSNIITGIISDKVLPTQFSLSAYPNPFNPATKIRYSIPAKGNKGSELVTLKVYDLLGREVAILVNEKQSAGTYEVEFAAGNLSSGIYLYRLTAGNYSGTKKIILLK